jgi:predicted 3-demethylubiquinone-9 3-methyltransferase (glyoxalase superfamily)
MDGCCAFLGRYGIPHRLQIIPTALFDLMTDKDAKKANRVMEAMLKMTKIDIAKLQQAYDQA